MLISKPRANPRRDREAVAAVIARSEATKQSSFTSWLHGLLRFARNDGLTPWSSLRKQGPITTDASCYKAVWPQRSIARRRRGSLLSQGRRLDLAHCHPSHARQS